MKSEHNKASILVVEDDEDILELIRYNLVKEGYRVLSAESGEEALKLSRVEKPDMVILDLMLPGIDGLEVCRQLKSDSNTKQILVVMLTAKAEETDQIIGLELGADDYLVKPFSPRVLIAHIRAIMRRAQESRNKQDTDSVVYGDILIHAGRHEVVKGNQKITLTATEFQILLLLARRPGWVYSRSQIVDAVRGIDYPVTDRSVDVHIVALRKKLGDHGHYIETVRGIGYKLKELV